MSLDTTITPIDSPTDVSQPGGLELPAGVTETPGGARAEIDLGAPTADQLAAPTKVQASFLENSPAGYADKEWVKNFAKSENPAAELYKSYEEQRATISRKMEGGLKIPDANSTPEQRAEFYKALGVPETAEGYEYKMPEAPKGQEQYYQIDNDLLTEMRQEAHKNGMTPTQWKAQTDVYNKRIAAAIQKQVETFENNQKLATETFNKQYRDKGPSVVANLEKAITSAPEWARPELQTLSPGQKVAVASVLFDFSTKYVSEDKLDVKSLGGPQQMTEADYGNEFEKQYAIAMKHRRQPQSPEYIGAMQKLASLRSAQKEMAGKR